MTQPRSLAKDPPMEIEWFINCIYETQIFTVPINSTNSVGQLQRVIIKQEFDIFKNVPAARLDLYLVNVKGSRREVIQAAQETIRNLESDDALNPIHRLAGIFPDGPPLDSLHIIIQVSDPTTLNKEHSPRRFLDDVTIAITNFVAHDAEPIISGFLNNPSPSVWRPPNGVDQDITDFYQSLEIPMRNVNEPDLLLHSLWKLAHEPERLKLMVPAAENHLILCNASTTGKTRLLLEHLCRSYAFYFVASTGADDIGSNDLPNTIKGLSADPDLQKIDRKKDATVIMSTSSGNGYSASTRILRVFTARWIIFHTFLRVSAEHNNGLLPEMTKYNWMLFQVLPLSHGDLFAQLVERLYGTHDEMLRTILEEHMDQARSLIYGSSNTNDRFHYILDEVQVAGNMHKEYFSDETGRFERSVLRSIIRMLHSLRNTLVILSGTGLDLSELRVVLNPGVGKDSTEARWNRQHDIGDFSSEASQERYLARYFPKKFLESPSGTAFKERVFEWLRGRHRFTARIIEVLKGPWSNSGPASPNKVLNKYVEAMSRALPMDSGSILAHSEPPLKSQILIDPFQWDKTLSDDNLVHDLALAVYQALLRGQDARIQGTPADKIVEFGVGRLLTISDTKTRVASIQEPLILVSIIHWLHDRAETVEKHLRLHLEFDEDTGFEGVVLVALTRILRGIELERIFDFHDVTPSWTRIPATIVAKRNNTYEDAVIPAHVPLSGLRKLVTYADGPDDVRKWLGGGEEPWCIPSMSMGPDLLTRVKLENGKVLLLVIQCNCYFSGNEATTTAEVTGNAIKRLVPSGYFHPAEDTEADREQQIDAMLQAFPRGSVTGEQYDILRVVVAYPLDTDFNSPSAYVREQLHRDSHPLAKLSATTLAAAYVTNPDGNSIVQALKASMNRRREEESESTEELKERRA